MKSSKLFKGLVCAFALVAIGTITNEVASAQTTTNTQTTANAPTMGQPTASPPAQATAAAPDSEDSYRLGTGDKVRVTVFGQDDLSGEFVIDDTGVVGLPMIGQVKAAGRSVHELEDAVTAKLADGYLVNPRVSVEVTNYRPFYIIGEVNKPGEYPYETGMTVLNAISLAGGYTYRADDAEVYIRHKDSSSEEKEPADGTVPVDPGDIIRVAERFF